MASYNASSSLIVAQTNLVISSRSDQAKPSFCIELSSSYRYIFNLVLVLMLKIIVEFVN